MYIFFTWRIQINRAKVFQSGNSQAIRLPKEFRTDQKEYVVRKFGDCIFLVPADDPWALLKQVVGKFDDDFLSDRNQPMISDLPKREPFDVFD